MIGKDEYGRLVKKSTPKSKELKTLPLAFGVGGLICCIGQAFRDIYSNFLPIGDKTAAMLTSITMVFLGSLLTGLGVYDKIGKFAGAGSIVPITGFANSVVSPAMEYNREGVVLGVMTKMFVVAGPVIVSGIVASIAVGLVYYIVGLF